MNSFLLYPDHGMNGEDSYPSFQDIYKDLNLNILLKTMARDDIFMMEQIRSIMMVPITNSDVLKYRYEIVQDFYNNSAWAKSIYEQARNGAKLAEQYKKELEQSRGKTAGKAGMMITTLNFISNAIVLFRQITESMHKSEVPFSSRGLLAFRDRMDACPWEEFEKFHNKIMFYTMGGEGIFSIQISGGLKLTQSRLMDCKNYKEIVLGGTSRKIRKLYYKMAKKDTILVEEEALVHDMKHFIQENIKQVLEHYKPWIDQALHLLCNFSREVAFYKGIYNFQCRMKELSLPLCYGEVSGDGSRKEINDLYELSLALYTQVYPVPNSMTNDRKHLTIITGANQGGKSTYLRSFGIAQIMMQCGMPVPANRFVSGLYSKIHTHFTRKEDAMLSRGRLEEEMKRMDGIISQLGQKSLLLLNESFASTTEKEGSQIAYNIIMPLYKKGIEVMMVTHLHEFAREMYEKKLPGAEFLVAERLDNGKRTFHMVPGMPHYSSYGTDLYQYMIGTLQ